MKIKSLALMLSSIFTIQGQAQVLEKLDFERSTEQVAINYGDVTAIEQTNVNPISGSYSLKVSAQSHFEIMRVFEINQTLTNPTQFRVSFDVQLPEIQNSKYQGNTTLYTSLIVEFDDASQMQVYTSEADNISQEPDSIHSFDVATTLPDGKHIKHVTAYWSTHLLDEMPVVFDNIEAQLTDNSEHSNTVIQHFLMDNTTTTTIEQLQRHFSGNIALAHANSNAPSLQINADNDGRYRTKFELSNLFIVHSTPNYVVTTLTLSNPSSETVEVKLAGQAYFTRELAGAANTISQYDRLTLAPNERKTIPLMLDFSDDYYTSNISSMNFEIEAERSIFIDSTRVHTAEVRSDGAFYQVFNDYESGNIDFTTRYPEEVTISLEDNNQLNNAKNLRLTLSPWRQASYSYFFPWSETRFATQIHTQLDVNITEATYGQPVQVCTDVYYKTGKKDSFCEVRTFGKGSYQVNEVYTLDPTQSLRRFLIRVRSFSNSPATVNIDNFSLKYWQPAFN
ncbi:hypothetical protein [Pseudoalteromonas luteoviolacea]|uniref:Uncharacterized protein n=1 Tax=Pseudoalteromonas luteoviolacea S4060-1 TaxID=1365257 RepID=A0A167MSH3_9GAMM|nr:hypothetical protein [Pseudoalteromonas luteoviolacea]KZN66873.1 hypothetical protein N478_18775 [Pseudoalteromonas luteoviolacea S4060-1]